MKCTVQIFFKNSDEDDGDDNMQKVQQVQLLFRYFIPYVLLKIR